MAHLLISAAHKSSGKTTVTLGLCAALHARGLKIQPFKKGPITSTDVARSGRDNPCHNLDFYTMERDEIRATVGYYSAQADISLIEATKVFMTALIWTQQQQCRARQAGSAPVILVIDARGMSAGLRR